VGASWVALGAVARGGLIGAKGGIGRRKTVVDCHEIIGDRKFRGRHIFPDKQGWLPKTVRKSSLRFSGRGFFRIHGCCL
jgi:hypothetical protein